MRIFKILLFFLFIFSIPSIIQAGFLDNVMNKAKQAAGDTYDKTLESVKGEDTPEQPPESQKGSTLTTKATGTNIITIADIPNGRRPATYASLGMARLLYDQGWLTEENLLKATELSIGCQQFFLKHGGVRGNGCMGEYLKTDKTLYKIRLAPIFSDEEIEGRNPQFAAKEFKARMKPALLKLAQHLPPEFGDTVSWRGSYDFENGTLIITISGYEQAPRNVVNKLPQSVLHLDLRNPRRANFKGTKGEYYMMKAWLPPVTGAYALAFDRDLNQGRVALPAAEAEKLFKDSSKNYVGGTAVVEFAVKATAGEAAIATLEQVRLLSAGGKIDMATVKPFMTIPASAFPKLEPPPKQAQVEKSKQKPVAAAQSAATAKKESAVAAEPDPLVRVKQGQAYGADIVGLQLGITLAEADQLVRKHKEPRKVIEGDPPRPFIRGRAYVLEPGDEVISMFTLKSPAGERIAGYIRSVYFDLNSPPSEIAIGSSVDKKYGVPSYFYEAKSSHFERRWLTNWKGEKIMQENINSGAIGKCERAARSNSGLKTWLTAEGKPYRWYVPGSEVNWNSPSILLPGDPKRTEKINYCGPTLIANFQTNAGQLYGPSLDFLLFDGAWIIDAVKKQNAVDTAKGATDLKL